VIDATHTARHSVGWFDRTLLPNAMNSNVANMLEECLRKGAKLLAEADLEMYRTDLKKEKVQNLV
jgi:hypothetical protein